MDAAEEKGTIQYIPKLKFEFDGAIKDWIEYYTSRSRLGHVKDLVIKDCDPCKRIILMGEGVLPLIEELSKSGPTGNAALDAIIDVGLSCAISEIKLRMDYYW
jgi:hypothetical protein